ncbi:S1 family peptidase [Vibrio quintilis]|uniref:Trypsin-like protease n=1 Tax=Vibrio quintilis TaxID=1117707 RepID=A0A1M7YTQ8_9VIBR|nr:serine protease [Vibrio quintilis]SHO56037.1 Trypsin-like protease precursor [Vibrio quintilis]
MKNIVPALVAAAGLFATPYMAYASADFSASLLSGSRIINGTQSAKNQWPFMAVLVTKGSNTVYSGQLCDGTFLGGRYVLTAAHCVVDEYTGKKTSANTLQVAIGVFDLKSSSAKKKLVNVSKIYSHPKYDGIVNDIAILKLAKEVSGTKVQLASQDLVNALQNGNTTTAIGWGATSATEDIYPAKLRQVDMPFVEWQTCQNLNSEYLSVDESNVCAGYLEGGKATCYGDSGGPLVYKDNGVYKQIGIDSWTGGDCAQANAYDVFTNVAYYTDWINNIMNN